MYLEKINSPADIKSYSLDEMKALAQEMRDALLKNSVFTADSAKKSPVFTARQILRC